MAAPAAAPVQSFAPAPHPPLPPKDQPSAVKSIFSDGWNKICALRPKLPSLRLRAPALFRSRSRALDARPRAQTELALEKVTVIRNDLSEANGNPKNRKAFRRPALRPGKIRGRASRRAGSNWAAPARPRSRPARPWNFSHDQHDRCQSFFTQQC
jgi:hypothetical protein